MKYAYEDLNFISKENFHSYNNESHVLSRSEKGFSSLKNLLTNIKDGNFSVLNSIDHLKNKKLVLHLREKMFRGFIKTKILSERRKLKSAAGESKDFNFMKDLKMEANSETGSKIHTQSKQNKFGFFIENFKNFSFKQNTTKDRESSNKPITKEKVFITDRENEVPAFLKNLIEYNLDTNIKESEANNNKEDEAKIRRKIFKDSFEAKQYKRINFVAFDISNPLINKNKNLNLNKANIKRDIIKQIQSLDKIYTARSKDVGMEKAKILELDKESNREAQYELQKNFTQDKNSSKAIKEVWMKDDYTNRTISAIKPYSIALRKREENSKIFRNSTALYRKREDISNDNRTSNTSQNQRKNIVLNTITNLKNKNITSSPYPGANSSGKIRPKTETKINTSDVKRFNEGIFSNIMLRDRIEVNPRKIDHVHLQNYKVNLNFIDIKNNYNDDAVSHSKERNYFDNQRILHVKNKHKRLIENKMVQTDFKNLMTNRKEKFQKLKESVFNFSKVHILLDSIKPPHHQNQNSISMYKKSKDGKNKFGDL